MPMKRGLAVTATAAAAEMGLIYLGRTYGSTKEERQALLPETTSCPTPGSRPIMR